jgi:hypothetical protein
MSDGRETPRARTSGLVVKALADEVLVYDLTRHRAHSLNRAAAAVWRRLDGRTSIGELARHLREELAGSADEQTVWLALKELDRAHLLEAPVPRLADAGISRRRLLGRMGLSVAAGTVLLPAVSSIVAPHPAEAQSACSAGVACDPTSCPGTNCFCTLTTEGGTFCWQDQFCSDVPACTSSADCAPGFACVDSCCGPFFCFPPCGTNPTTLSRSAGRRGSSR